MELVKREIDNLTDDNSKNLHSQFQQLQAAYEIALKSDLTKFDNSIVYTPERMNEYGIDFLSYVDPRFVQDIQNNLEWYMENYNDILVNVAYPSKQEKEFLKHVEYVQQKKNDLKYKKILK